VKVVVKNIGNSFKLLGGIIAVLPRMKALFTLTSGNEERYEPASKAVGNNFKQHGRM
jgi:hypothetical protein